ncbi:MAG: UPF0158 family protein [Dehalococcoidales bacterium]|nr:UPF0158 family protein [Dehalococcoidales bacterium]
MAEAIERGDAPEWMKDMLLEAHRIELAYGTRYIRVPRDETSEAYSDREAFIDTVSDQLLRRQLERAIHGRGAFRYFRDVLADYPAEQQRWYAFKEAQLRERILEWLDDEGIEPILEPPPKTG